LDTLELINRLNSLILEVNSLIFMFADMIISNMVVGSLIIYYEASKCCKKVGIYYNP